MKNSLIFLFATILGLSNTCAQTTNALDMKAVVEGNTQFAIDLLGKLKESDGNLFFSPFSISAALAMTYGGAGGNTSDQMAKALHFPVQGDRLHAAFAALLSELGEAQKKGKIQLSIADSLWYQKDHPFLKTYLDLARTSYSAGIAPVDFASDAESARQTINKWVETNTQRKITDLLPSGCLDSLTRLVLVNAIYFKGMWASKFDKNETKEEDFKFINGKRAKVAMMRQEGTFSYTATAEVQMLGLFYSDEGLAMIILLPRKDGGIRDLDNEITRNKLRDWTSRFRKTEVIVNLPKFKLTSSTELSRALASLGMYDAFDRNKADFSGMDGQKNWLYISTVFHKAFVDVNEEGTEAAAATAAVVQTLGEGSSPIPIVFRADHPFLFMIIDNRTHSILFLGRVMDPRG